LNAERKLAKLQRRHSRTIKGSKNREKARIKLARGHLKVFNQRTDFLHKLSYSLWKDNGIICGEKLNIQNMLKSNLAKHILDVSWGKFYQMLSYKAVTSGGELRQNPKTRGSSHRCSSCGFYVREMPLSQRIFQCPKCGYTIHRDINSSKNHIKDTDGLSEITTPVETRPLPLRFAKASRINESGTIIGN
jgi:putative transposase